MYFYLPTNSSNVNALTGFTVLEFRCFRIEKTFFFHIYINLQCHLFGDVRSELFSLSQCVCVRDFVKENCAVIMCDCVCLCVFLYGEEGCSRA